MLLLDPRMGEVGTVGHRLDGTPDTASGGPLRWAPWPG
ncbi:hypothetical protein RAJCM14343_2416 [Rhodococcus aetherivorans]|uniref:Uncharacterized protein n=1 Tax=Rhodococcus aetherivorans TaxID=191292 RepID=A0ABQ0YKU0_9NOCA|nr:hypothetical protein RAJCM14343_2416 [Rhodococcus aetherivorans]CCW12286.1 hypothetical protein EBESD8_28350 [Rhodococcus aetherivorans]